MTCGFCLGSGLQSGHKKSICPLCLGDKNILSMKHFVKSAITCIECNGDGEVILDKDKCTHCKGTGLVIESLAVEVETTPEPVENISKGKEILDKVKSSTTSVVSKIRMPTIKNPFKKKDPSN